MLHPPSLLAFGCKGLGLLNEGKTLFINISLHKEGGLFLFRGSRQIGFSLSWLSCTIASQLVHLQRQTRGSFVVSCSFPWQPIPPWQAPAERRRVDKLQARKQLSVGAEESKSKNGACHHDWLYVIALIPLSASHGFQPLEAVNNVF